MNEVVKNGWEGRLAFLIEHCIYAVAFFLPLSLDVASVFLITGALGWGVKSLCFARAVTGKLLFWIGRWELSLF